MAFIRFTRTRLLALSAALQVLCGALLLVDILSELPELEVDRRHAALEMAIVGTLLLGALLAVTEIRRMQSQAARMTSRLRAASGAFVALVEDSFAGWGLTPAEREVALLALKGFSVAEIAALRGAREGTVRAQCAAVYRKAGVAGRAQLVAHFVDDLLDGVDLAGGAGRAAAKGR